VGESMEKPDLYEQANVKEGGQLLDAMREHGVGDLVFSSSAAVYDPSAPMPLTETAPLRPTNPYGETKLRFERMLEERAARGELRHVGERRGSRAFNLGAGRGVSVREVVEAVRGVTGREVGTVDAPRRAGDPPVLIASSEAARHVLGWDPQFEELHVILETAWDW